MERFKKTAERILLNDGTAEFAVDYRASSWENRPSQQNGFLHPFSLIPTGASNRKDAARLQTEDITFADFIAHCPELAIVDQRWQFVIRQSRASLTARWRRSHTRPDVTFEALEELAESVSADFSRALGVYHLPVFDKLDLLEAVAERIGLRNRSRSDQRLILKLLVLKVAHSHICRNVVFLWEFALAREWNMNSPFTPSLLRCMVGLEKALFGTSVQILAYILPRPPVQKIAIVSSAERLRNQFRALLTVSPGDPFRYVLPDKDAGKLRELEIHLKVSPQAQVDAVVVLLSPEATPADVNHARAEAPGKRHLWLAANPEAVRGYFTDSASIRELVMSPKALLGLWS
jgi:hypothetical protein